MNVKIDKECPSCGSQMLSNGKQEWCSSDECFYGQECSICRRSDNGDDVHVEPVYEGPSFKLICEDCEYAYATGAE